jgi:hypothetical protein
MGYGQRKYEKPLRRRLSRPGCGFRFQTPRQLSVPPLRSHQPEKNSASKNICTIYFFFMQTKSDRDCQEKLPHGGSNGSWRCRERSRGAGENSRQAIGERRSRTKTAALGGKRPCCTGFEGLIDWGLKVGYGLEDTPASSDVLGGTLVFDQRAAIRVGGRLVESVQWRPIANTQF